MFFLCIGINLCDFIAIVCRFEYIKCMQHNGMSANLKLFSDLQAYLKSNANDYSKEEVEILWMKSTER